MSVFDENRTQCEYCGKYINHWEQSSNDLHDSAECTAELTKHYNKLKDMIDEINGIEMEMKNKNDYLLDLQYTLADI